MLQKCTGWFFILIMFSGFIMLLAEVSAEMDEVQSLEQMIEERVTLKDITLSSNSYIYDRDGKLVSEIYEENRIYLPIEQIPERFIDAFIATEDHRFFEHKGYDLSSIVRAAVTNVKNQTIEEGASTMTQQLVRNLFLSHEVSYDRKFNELLYAYELEKTYSKENIIEMYLNTIYFHNGVYGIEAASQFYLDKSSSELSLAEIAFLSAVPNNPSHYNPIKNSERTKLRQEWILTKMSEQEMIEDSELEEALKEPIVLDVQNRVDRYPDYVTYIHHELRELVAEAEGFRSRLAQAPDAETEEAIDHELDNRVAALLEQGLHIETALDPPLQENAVQALNKRLGSSSIQGASVIIDHHSHEIVAITGGTDYQKFDFHRGYQNYRQPGSSIKPLLVYGPYLDQHDLLLGSTVNADNFCIGNYCPKNYGGGQYGNVSLRTAFKYSYNTPAVRLLNSLSVETAFSYLENFGFEQLDPNDYRLPSALGGFTYGVSPLEMTRAYTVFAQGGAYTPAYGIRSVKNKAGEIVYAWDQAKTELWKASANDKMRELLKEVVASGTGQHAAFTAPYLGGKTGTTNEYHDLWFVGLTDSYTAGIWVGKDKRESIYSFSRNNPHLLIWREMLASH